MSLQAPAMLWLLLLVPAALVGAWLLERRRVRRGPGYADAHLSGSVVLRAPAGRRRWALGLQLLALALLLLAAARPVATPPLRTNEAATVIALDASRSMLADDATPNRLEAARAVAETFVRDAPRSARIGLISFSDVASLLVPPTTDHAEVLRALERVQVGQNTSLTGAVVAGVKLLPGRKGLQPPATPADPTPSRSAPGAVLLLSDGVGTISNNPALPEDVALTLAARFAADHDVTIDAVPVGREGGAVTRLAGQDYFVPYAPQNLERLASISGGSVLSPDDPRALRRLARRLGTVIRWVPRQLEVSAPLAAVAVALLLGAGALSLGAYRRLP